MDEIDQSSTYPEIATLIPGYEATLEAHPSGPSGMGLGPGTGDNIGKRVLFEPFQAVRPEYCDPALSEQN